MAWTLTVRTNKKIRTMMAKGVRMASMLEKGRVSAFSARAILPAISALQEVSILLATSGSTLAKDRSSATVTGAFHDLTISDNTPRLFM